MILSRSSSIDADPLSRTVDELGDRSVRCTRFEAAGRWSLAFPARRRLKFAVVLRGRCWLSPPGEAAVVLAAGDAIVIGEIPFAVASDLAIPSADGARFYPASVDAARLGGDDTAMLAGGLTFEEEPMRSLLDALPPFTLIPGVSPSAAVIGEVLGRLDREVRRPRPGGPLLTSRLADLLLVEALRARAEDGPPQGGGIVDRHIAAALRLMHDDVAAPWTVARLAASVGMSRSAFASRFADLVGRPPLDYLRHRRMTLACRALGEAGAEIADVADRVGYASRSAFGHAYKRAFGRSPRRHRRPVD